MLNFQVAAIISTTNREWIIASPLEGQKSIEMPYSIKDIGKKEADSISRKEIIFLVNLAKDASFRIDERSDALEIINSFLYELYNIRYRWSRSERKLFKRVQKSVINIALNKKNTLPLRYKAAETLIFPRTYERVATVELSEAIQENRLFPKKLHFISELLEKILKRSAKKELAEYEKKMVRDKLRKWLRELPQNKAKNPSYTLSEDEALDHMVRNYFENPAYCKLGDNQAEIELRKEVPWWDWSGELPETLITNRAVLLL